nr:DEAD-box ATP-dependent RNA helicase 42-like [Aedes albopictus]
MSGPYVLPVADHLLEEEVDFDLKLRGQDVDRRETLEDKRRFLRRLLLEEKKAKSVLIGKHNFDDEVLRIDKTIKVLESNLSKKFDLAHISRLRHYFIRAQTAITNDDSERHTQAKLCEQIAEILKSFNQKVYAELNDGEIETDRESRKTDGSEVKDRNEDSDATGTEKEQNKEKNQQQIRKEKDRNKKEEKTVSHEDEIEKQKELEEEWKEFQLWKQDRLYEEARRKHFERKEKVEMRPPKSNKSQHSQRHSREEESQGESDDDRGPPKSHKSLKSSRDRSLDIKDSRRESTPTPSVEFWSCPLEILVHRLHGGY